MKRLLYVLLASAATLVALLACLALRLPGSTSAAPLLASVPFTPENGARRMACGFGFPEADPPRDFQVHATYRVPSGALVVYTGQCPPGGEIPDLAGPVIGAAHAERMEGWAGLVAYDAGGGSSAGRLPSEREPVVVGADSRRGWALVYGRVLEPRVAAVEVDFDDGRRLQTEAEGVFSLMARGTEAACELRALDADGNVVARVGADELGGSPLLAQGEAPPANNCPP